MIQQNIRGIVATLDVPGSSPSVAPQFLYGWRGQLNLRADELSTDVIWLLPVRSNSQLTGMSLKDNYSIVMGFFGKSELDMFAEQHDLLIVDRQRAQCAKFLYKITNSDITDELTNIVIQDEFNVFDIGLSGVTIQFNIKLINSYPAC